MKINKTSQEKTNTCNQKRVSYLPSLGALLGEFREDDILFGMFLLVLLPARLHEEGVRRHAALGPRITFTTRHPSLCGYWRLNGEVLLLKNGLVLWRLDLLLQMVVLVLSRLQQRVDVAMMVFLGINAEKHDVSDIS